MENPNILFKKPSKIVIFFSLILMVINLYLAYLAGGTVGYVVGFVFFPIMFVISIASIFKAYRNSNSRWIITLNMMLVVLLANFGNLLESVQATN